MARTTEKIVELQGRKFKISAFDAFTGSYIAFTLFSKMMPMGMEDKVTGVLKAEGKSVDATLPQGRALMTKGEFFAFQKDCLGVVSEVLKGREAPILNANGSWGVDDIEKNTVLVMLLTIHSLAFNVSAFFSDGGLKELRTSLQSLLPSNTPT
jgi:hypothetical protein